MNKPPNSLHFLYKVFLIFNSSHVQIKLSHDHIFDKNISLSNL